MSRCDWSIVPGSLRPHTRLPQLYVVSLQLVPDERVPDQPLRPVFWYARALPAGTWCDFREVFDGFDDRSPVISHLINHGSANQVGVLVCVAEIVHNGTTCDGRRATYKRATGFQLVSRSSQLFTGSWSTA